MSGAITPPFLGYKERAEFISTEGMGNSHGSSLADTTQVEELEERFNSIAGCSVSAGGVITLPAGEYYVSYCATGQKVNGFRAQFMSPSYVNAVIEGMSARSNSGDNTSMQSSGDGFLSLATPHDFTVEPYYQSVYATSGRGVKAGLSHVAAQGRELFAKVSILKLRNAVSGGATWELNDTLLSATGWTAGANWAKTVAKYSHTAGSTATLTRDFVFDAYRGYAVEVKTQGHAGQYLDVSIGAGGSKWRMLGDGWHRFGMASKAADTVITFTPHTNFAGDILNLKIARADNAPGMGA